jgi:hypothetical protein
MGTECIAIILQAFMPEIIVGNEYIRVAPDNVGLQKGQKCSLQRLVTETGRFILSITFVQISANRIISPAQ